MNNIPTTGELFASRKKLEEAALVDPLAVGV